MIFDDLKAKQVEYMKSKDSLRLGVLRLFISQVKNKEIELRPQNTELTDEVTFKVLKKLIKQKKEALELAEKAGRNEVVSVEKADLNVLMEFVSFYPFLLE